MSFIKNLKQNWQTLVIGYRFMQLVKSPYGDFSGIRFGSTYMMNI